MNKTQINLSIESLSREMGNLRKSHERDPKYQKLQAKWVKLDQEMHAIEKAHIKANEARAAEIRKELQELAIRKKANVQHVVLPKNLSTKFRQWWNDLQGNNAFSKRMVPVWVDDNEKYCLIKIPNSPPDWLLFKVGESEAHLHHTQGRINKIKIAAMEAKMDGIYIKF